MKPGDRCEIAIWLDGTETLELIQRWKEDVREQANLFEQNLNVTIGPFEFNMKRPGEERVPQVPEHVSGPDVRLLVAEADVTAGHFTIWKATGFVHDLTQPDLERLRKITRHAHALAHPGDKLDDQHCDSIIEQLGPKLIEEMLLRNDGSTRN